MTRAPLIVATCGGTYTPRGIVGICSGCSNRSDAVTPGMTADGQLSPARKVGGVWTCDARRFDGERVVEVGAQEA